MGGADQETAEKREVKGCIKSGRGPWVVHRTTKDGRVTTKYRFPSDIERLRNRDRERNRRNVTRKIFSGLRAFGNYQLPKNADTTDLLKAVCEEAGWHVEEDGNVYKKVLTEDGDYCECDENMETIKSRSKMAQKDYHDTNVTLSLTLAS